MRTALQFLEMMLFMAMLLVFDSNTEILEVIYLLVILSCAGHLTTNIFTKILVFLWKQKSKAKLIGGLFFWFVLSGFFIVVMLY